MLREQEEIPLFACLPRLISCGDQVTHSALLQARLSEKNVDISGPRGPDGLPASRHQARAQRPRQEEDRQHQLRAGEGGQGAPAGEGKVEDERHERVTP